MMLQTGRTFVENMLEPHGQAVKISAFVVANHVFNATVVHKMARDFDICSECANCVVFKVQQNMVESASFGSEFVAPQVAKDLVVALRHELLQMFGVWLEEEADVFCCSQGTAKRMRACLSLH